ncbi:3-dehydroquinate synthase family protein [uncultured Treponema sp.]|uniref:3-dehydroquinate synthase n=1 Tax=uncultured Treponema sp. TaxID=162155 RepID=UPI002582C85C|nr:3-dehydroquinate synthase family protein [uncultured Treponema sp.]
MNISPIDNFELLFPDNSGFDKTDILFYSGKNDLCSLYLSVENKRNRLFVTDTNIAPLCTDFISHFTDENADNIKAPSIFKKGNDTLCILGAGEKYKTIENVLEIVRAALNSNFNRNCLFVAIGGGVLSDMTGFAASMFKRGVDVEFVPTTLLSDVDASIGGKTGCDFDSYKNMIGAFYPAKKIHIWSSFIQSLPQNEFISGLGEVVKTAFLFSPELTEILKTQKEKVMSRNEEVLQKIITICAKAKAKTVHEDFKEKGIRAYLNYGHTFGHALETVAGLGKISHGEAVAWGIGRALGLSLDKNLCSAEFAKECKSILFDYGFCTDPLPQIIKDIPNATLALVSAMHKDKKNSGSCVKVILQKTGQSTFITEVQDNEILEVLK